MFRPGNEVELTVDSIFLKCANDTVFRAITTKFENCVTTQLRRISYLGFMRHGGLDLRPFNLKMIWRVMLPMRNLCAKFKPSKSYCSYNTDKDRQKYVDLMTLNFNHITL